MTTTAPTRPQLIQALQSQGFLLVADLPKPVKVVKRRELHTDDAVFMEIDTEALAAYRALP